MTEEAWLACGEPIPMLEFIQGKASDRKLRLVSVALCRGVWGLMEDGRSRVAVEVSERFADDAGLRVEVEAAYTAAIEAWQVSAEDEEDERGVAANAAVDVSYPAFADAGRIARQLRGLSDEAAPGGQAALVRDVFGNPFSPVTVHPSWLTPTVVALARGVYEQRAFDRMPILADALEEAGCDHPAVLTHCRADGTHVRGCWVVDQLLSKK